MSFGCQLMGWLVRVENENLWSLGPDPACASLRARCTVLISANLSDYLTVDCSVKRIDGLPRRFVFNSICYTFRFPSDAGIHTSKVLGCLVIVYIARGIEKHKKRGLKDRGWWVKSELALGGKNTELLSKKENERNRGKLSLVHVFISAKMGTEKSQGEGGGSRKWNDRTRDVNDWEREVSNRCVREGVEYRMAVITCRILDSVAPQGDEENRSRRE